MSKIVALGSSPPPRDREFRLEDLSDDVLDTGSGAIATFRHATKGDWSNQELASIYRAVRLLQGTGVAVETDRGVSDDGSPWCVFCGSQGDVLVHIARIDQQYVVDGVGLDAPLMGKTFDELINCFISRTVDQDTSARQAGPLDVLNLSKRRSDKLFVHPAAQLAALLWAAMVIKNVAGADAGEMRGTGFQSEPQNLLSDHSDVIRPVASGDSRQRLPDKPEVTILDAFAKSRDGGLATSVQAAGLMSLAYLLVGQVHTSPAAVLERHSLNMEDYRENGAIESAVNPTLSLFVSALNIFKDIVPFVHDDAKTASQDKDTGTAIASVSIGIQDFLSSLKAIPDTIVDVGLSLDEQISIKTPGPTALAVEQDPQIAANKAESGDEAGVSLTVDDLVEYLEGIADLYSQDLGAYTDEVSVLLEGSEGQNANTAFADKGVDDGEVIAAILEFLKTADEAFTYYRGEEMHIVEQVGALSEGNPDLLSFSWTFEDGSQIVIVGAADDLSGLDLLL